MWMRVALPLFICLVIFVLLHFRVDGTDGLFINLITEFIGIGFTVFYVDLVLKRHEKSKWHDVEDLVQNRIIIFLNKIVLGIRVAFNISRDEVLGTKLNEGEFDIKSLSRIVVRYASNKLSTLSLEKLNEMDKKQWENFINYLLNAYSEIDVLLQNYSKVLTPEQLKHLLQIQNYLEEATTGYNIFPEIGDSELLQKNPRMAADLKPMIKQTADKIESLLREIKTFSEMLTEGD